MDLTYFNLRLKTMLELAQGQQRRGCYLASGADNYGLGNDNLWKVEMNYRRGYGNNDVYISPYGKVHKIDNPSYFPDIYSIEVGDPEKVPEALLDNRPLAIGEGKVDVDKRLCTITAVDSNGEVWTIEYQGIDVKQNPGQLADTLNKSLVANHQRITIVGMVYDKDTYSIPTVYKPFVRNEHLMSLVYGYALDSQLIVYLGLVSARVSIDSIRATLIQGNALNLCSTPLAGYLTVHPIEGEKYLMESCPLPVYGNNAAGLLARKAHKWDGNDLISYALVFDGSDLGPQEVLFRKIQEISQAPLKDEWQGSILKAAKDFGLVGDLAVWGACTKGYKIDCNQKKWNMVVDTLLKDRQIQI